MYKYFLGACLFFIISCNQHARKTDKQTTRAFYYWKSVFKLNDYEKATVDSLHTNSIYLKYFDIDWNDKTNQPNPVAQIKIIDTAYLQTINIIPVVFITNECILKIDASQTTEIAEKIYKLVHAISANNQLNNITELQIDCDWTESTREKYFAILKRIKSLSGSLLLSATIRLHQVKYVSRSGIPPVDKGLLMCYNMGNLKNPATANSIIETAELKKYIVNLDKYPLKLDVAFPIFEWAVLFKNGSYAGLVKDMPGDSLKNSFTQKNDNRYQFLKDTILMGYTFKKNDVLRFEKSDYASVMSSAKEINDRLAETNIRVVLFHLDSITLSKYSLHEMENIFNSIH